MYLQTFLKREIFRDLPEFISYYWECIKITDISQFNYPAKLVISRSKSGLWLVFPAETNAIMLNESKHDPCYMDQALFAKQVLKYAEIIVSNRIFPIGVSNSWSLFILNSCSRSSSLRKLSIERTIWMNYLRHTYFIEIFDWIVSLIVNHWIHASSFFSPVIEKRTSN